MHDLALSLVETMQVKMVRFGQVRGSSVLLRLLLLAVKVRLVVLGLFLVRVVCSASLGPFRLLLVGLLGFLEVPVVTLWCLGEALGFSLALVVASWSWP